MSEMWRNSENTMVWSKYNLRNIQICCIHVIDKLLCPMTNWLIVTKITIIDVMITIVMTIIVFLIFFFNWHFFVCLYFYLPTFIVFGHIFFTKLWKHRNQNIIPIVVTWRRKISRILVNVKSISPILQRVSIE